MWLFLLSIFSLYKAYFNYDREFCNYMLEQKENYIYCYSYLDAIRLFSQPYFIGSNKELLKTLIGGKIELYGISGFEYKYIDKNGLQRYGGAGGRWWGSKSDLIVETYKNQDCHVVNIYGGVDYIFNDHELLSKLKNIDSDILKWLLNKKNYLF